MLYLGERAAARSLSHPHPLADADTLSCKHAKACLLGEGWGEGVFCSDKAIKRI